MRIVTNPLSLTVRSTHGEVILGIAYTNRGLVKI
jgi:hypothetical protein